jgi:alkanesulfonate monooxygenase SsuD/methylene tetrahydromethanopterin reductase-like flavin-dependent oxidoreductase (luciferase family)
MVPRDPDDLAAINVHVEETKKLAHEQGRELSVMVSVGIVCADTERAARRQLDHYVRDLGDWDAVRAFTGGQRAKAPDYRFDSQEARALVGHYAVPLVGTPDQVVEGFQHLAKAGLEGAALSWVDYDEGIRQYDELIRPLMIEAGLRAS